MGLLQTGHDQSPSKELLQWEGLVGFYDGKAHHPTNLPPMRDSYIGEGKR
jgi:hypothetical protein